MNNGPWFDVNLKTCQFLNNVYHVLMKSKRHIQTHAVTDPAQRKALASPLRQEILGRWTDGEPRTVADIAAVMGRPATAIYYHMHQLEKVGLLIRAGSRPGPKRDEILYKPVAKEFDLTPTPGDPEQIADAMAALTTANRMALGDLKASFESGEDRFDGPDRSILAFRLHARLTDEKKARANALLDELLTLFQDESSTDKVADAEFFSLTVALAPLRGRDQKDDS